MENGFNERLNLDVPSEYLIADVTLQVYNEFRKIRISKGRLHESWDGMIFISHLFVNFYPGMFLVRIFKRGQKLKYGGYFEKYRTKLLRILYVVEAAQSILYIYREQFFTLTCKYCDQNNVLYHPTGRRDMKCGLYMNKNIKL